MKILAPEPIELIWASESLAAPEIDPVQGGPGGEGGGGGGGGRVAGGVHVCEEGAGAGGGLVALVQLGGPQSWPRAQPDLRQV